MPFKTSGKHQQLVSNAGPFPERPDRCRFGGIIPGIRSECLEIVPVSKNLLNLGFGIGRLLAHHRLRMNHPPGNQRKQSEQQVFQIFHILILLVNG